MLRILSLILTIIAIVFTVVLFVGYKTPPEYTDSISFVVSYSVELTWQELLKIEQIPNRKKDVVSVTVLEQYGKLTAWKEDLINGGYRIYRMNERQENKRLVLELTSSSYGLTGIWEFDLEPEGTDTLVTISEKSMLTDIKTRGIRAILGRNEDLLVWVKYIRVGLLQALLITP